MAFNALTVDEVDMYLEFTGTALTALLDRQPKPGSNEKEVYEQAKELGIEKISDMEDYTKELTAGITFEFADREDGYIGIQEVYVFSFDNVETMDQGLRTRAVEAGEVYFIDAYSTNADMVKYDLFSLEDDKDLFPPYQGAPLLKQETLDEYAELAEILNQLSGNITDEEMNYKVDYEDKDPSAVAKEHLTNNGFLS
ncbi:glycine betaine ABC transporter substrate-binding protein [Alteribacillus bidgolensis]|uniref:Osmoprotectant transport system permease protein n=1 Tax=Alteribacillus bidgolensis TaxID=930129 RepID=A0A1G8CYW2_9BACI|nr:glycine betaine ABC transporter substrate-binding protein [Alteribacillus bidgolensis]SDH50708.1 osmoprotectant transport system permease protein [Alteribacillus bidgolensis]